MRCPVCREAMIVLEWERVEIDHCPACKGIWLDKGELELLLEKSDDKNRILSSLAMCEKQNSKSRKCPICLKKMEQVGCGPNSNLTVDWCPKQDGIWFDAGELSALLKSEFFSGQTKISEWLEDIFSKTLTGGVK